jgi:hypothetical protein
LQVTKKSKLRSADLIDAAGHGTAAARIEADDLAWAKPYVDEARASVARGDVMSGEEFFRRLAAKL